MHEIGMFGRMGPLQTEGFSGCPLGETKTAYPQCRRQLNAPKEETMRTSMRANPTTGFRGTGLLATFCSGVIPLLFAAPAAHAQASGNPISVGPNVQISSAFGERPHGEVIAAADPDNTARMVACAMVNHEDRNLTAQHCYSSFDGGRSWDPTLILDEAALSGDPTAYYSRGDTAFVVALIRSLAIPRSAGEFRTHIFRSLNGGRTWTETADYIFIDREYITGDRTGGKYDGRIYINGQSRLGGMRDERRDERPPGIYLHRSTDGGKTFLGPTVRANMEGGGMAGVTNMVVLSDGTVGMIFTHTKRGRRQDLEVNNTDDSANATIEFIYSKDGGETLEQSVIVSDFFMDRPRSEGANVGQLTVDATEGPFKDRLYTVWPGVREDRVQAVFSYSADSGKAWSKPTIVNDDRSFADKGKKRDHILPAVAVNKDGVVAVSWYDRRESQDNLGWRVRIAASLDGGETFSASVPVSSKPNAYTDDNHWPLAAQANSDSANASLTVSLSLANFFESGGHTTGLVADADGVFHPVWVDNRTGIGQLWTAPVTVQGRAVKNGSPDLAELENLSNRVALELTNNGYDRRSNTLRVTAQLKNVSQETISGPVKIRVVRLESQVGVLEILNTDNGERGIGAVWDLTSLLRNGVLLPDSMSAGRELEFRLSDLQPLKSGRDYQKVLVDFEARVLGRAGSR